MNQGHTVRIGRAGSMASILIDGQPFPYDVKFGTIGVEVDPELNQQIVYLPIVASRFIADPYPTLQDKLPGGDA